MIKRFLLFGFLLFSSSAFSDGWTRYICSSNPAYVAQCNATEFWSSCSMVSDDEHCADGEHVDGWVGEGSPPPDCGEFGDYASGTIVLAPGQDMPSTFTQGGCTYSVSGDQPILGTDEDGNEGNCQTDSATGQTVCAWSGISGGPAEDAPDDVEDVPSFGAEIITEGETTTETTIEGNTETTRTTSSSSTFNGDDGTTEYTSTDVTVTRDTSTNDEVTRTVTTETSVDRYTGVTTETVTTTVTDENGNETVESVQVTSTQDGTGTQTKNEDSIESSVSDGEYCAPPPICKGDVLQCEIIYQSWLNRCKPEQGMGDFNDPSEFYTPDDEKTYESVLEEFQEGLDNSPFISAVDNFFTISVGGSCPVWSVQAWIFTITLDQFYSTNIPWGLISGMILFIATIVAGRIALT